jgi:hypothetical protein
MQTRMSDDLRGYGPLVAAVGAIALGVSVFLPWYGVSFTPSGLAFTRQIGDQFVSQFGNSALQSQLGSFHAALSGLAGHEVVSVSARDALSTIHVILLVLAGAALLATLRMLGASGGSLLEAQRGWIALLGLVAGALVLYRIVVPPLPEGGLIALSLREGAWIGLVASVAMIAGGLWPSRTARSMPSEADLRKALSSLTGSTSGR